MIMKNLISCINYGLYEEAYAHIVKYVNDPLHPIFHPNFYKSHIMIDNDLHIAVVEYWEYYNIPPIFSVDS